MANEERRRLLERLTQLEEESAAFQRELGRLKADLLRSEPAASGEPSAVTARKTPEAAVAASRPAPTEEPPSARTTAIGRAATLADIEFWLGGRGLLLLGVLALVLAVGLFLKYAIDQGWIGPGVRVILGAAVGAFAVGLGDRLRARGYRTYGLWLSAGGFGAIYLSVWAAAQLYALVSVAVGFLLMAAVVGAAAALGLVRQSEAFVTLAAFGGYLAPILLTVEPESPLFGLGYLAILSGAALWVSHRAGWRYLAAVAVAGGSLMALPGEGAAHLHGVYLVTLVAATLFVARRREWPGLSVLAVALGWIALAAGSGDWGIAGLKLAAYAAALWAANLIASVGVRDWVGAELRARLGSQDITADSKVRFSEFRGMAVSLLPPWLFFLFVNVGIGDSPYREWQDTVGLILGLAIGGFYLLLATYGPPAEGVASRVWRSSLGYSFWIVAPALQWSDIALMRAWLVEGAVFTGAGVLLRSAETRAVGLVAFVLAVLGFGNMLRHPATDPAFVSGWALTGLGVPVGVGGWALAANQLSRPARWETGIRPFVLLLSAILFLLWGTGEIVRFFQLLGDAGRWALARDLSISGFWVAYAAALLGVGLALKRAPVRWAGLVMALIAAGKVFLYDLANLAQLYRVVSFILLAVVLLALSFGYQKLRGGGET